MWPPEGVAGDLSGDRSKLGERHRCPVLREILAVLAPLGLVFRQPEHEFPIRDRNLIARLRVHRDRALNSTHGVGRIGADHLLTNIRHRMALTRRSRAGVSSLHVLLHLVRRDSPCGGTGYPRGLLAVATPDLVPE